MVREEYSLYRSEFQKITTMKKDAIYRLKNHEKMPWRSILYGVAKRLQTLTNPEKVVADTSAFIIDDTTDTRVGRHIENVSYIFDHVVGKTVLGFKDLVLGYFDGTSFTALGFQHSRGKGVTREGAQGTVQENWRAGIARNQTTQRMHRG